MWYCTELIIECIAVCLIYGIIMTFLMICFKEFWIQEYPDAVREKYLEVPQDALRESYPQWRSRDKREYFLWMFIKKIIALCIYLIVMFAVSLTVEEDVIFIDENLSYMYIIWAVITLFEVLVLDIGVIAHVKKVRLPGTEHLDREYRKIGKKALKDVAAGILSAYVVFYVLMIVSTAAMLIEIIQLETETARRREESEKLQQSFYADKDIDSEPLDSYSNLMDWLTKDNEQEEDYAADNETDLGIAGGSELDELADTFAELTEKIHQVVEYKDESLEAQHMNDNRQIVRERPVFAGESLWSIAEAVYGDPFKWYDIYEVNKDIIGADPARIYKEQYLMLPEDETRDSTDYESVYRKIVSETGDWEGITEYIAPDCGYEVQNCIFYYTLPEGNGEQFKICYPKLVSLNGKDVSAINAGIRRRALCNAEYMLINRTEDFEQWLQTDDGYSTEWVRDQVNYVITYLDENTISVVFQYYVFEGSIYAEYLEMQSYVADINTGKRYMTTELLTNLEDGIVAEAVHEDIISFYEEKEKEFQIWAFNEIMTAELINETLQSDDFVEGRYFSNVFLTPDGVGIGFVYRMNKKVDGYSQILRGWKNVILPREQVKDYLTDAVVWEYTDIPENNG